jgi:lipoprotein-anchoring transpeptidase ErfK/SrfK
MVPSAFRLAGLALLVTVAALVASPALRQGVDVDRADARPAAAAPIPELEPVRVLARARTVADGPAEDAPAADAPAPRTKPKTPSYTVARVRAGHTVKLRAKPGGSTIANLGPRTEFGSKRVLAVAAVRGRWLGVSVPERPNGKLGWIDSRSDAIDRSRVKVSLRADLSKRRVDLVVGRRVVKRMKVAIGRPGSTTPTGRFAVTDKIPGNRYGPYYGCCILALSGHQPNTPAGWKGGNRLAVHGTNAPGTIGEAASAGCLRGSDSDLRTLMRRVPVGTPIFIRR